MSDQPTAWQFQFRSEMTHQVRFKGTGLGVMFEDDGETGYLYATNEQHDEIFDALHLYNRGDGDELAPGEEAYIVFSHTLRKAGIFYCVFRSTRSLVPAGPDRSFRLDPIT